MSIVTAHEGVNRVPKSWYASAGGVNRKLKSIYGAAGGASRKIFSGAVTWTFLPYAAEGNIPYNTNTSSMVYDPKAPGSGIAYSLIGDAEYVFSEPLVMNPGDSITTSVSYSGPDNGTVQNRATVLLYSNGDYSSGTYLATVYSNAESQATYTFTATSLIADLWIRLQVGNSNIYYGVAYITIQNGLGNFMLNSSGTSDQ